MMKYVSVYFKFKGGDLMCNLEDNSGGYKFGNARRKVV